VAAVIIDGKYEIARQLGEGGMAVVYEAMRLETGERVALKVISEENAHDAECVRRFQREARTVSKLQAPNIIRLVETGKDPASGSVYMAMDLLVGEDLDQCIMRLGALDPIVAVKIAVQACRGLKAAHDAKIVHRDIKPANIYLAENPKEDSLSIKVLDFGIAKINDEKATSGHAKLTQTGAVMGSPLYMSPEQAKGSGEIDERTDVWSLGAVLYEMLAGRPPHDTQGGVGELIIAICTMPAASIQKVSPWVTGEIADVVHRCLDLRRELRFADATELLAALEALVPDGSVVTKSMIVAPTPAARALSASRVRPRSPSAPGFSEADTGILSPAPALARTNPSSTRPTAPRSSRWGIIASVGVLACIGAAIGFSVHAKSAATRDPNAPATSPLAASAPLGSIGASGSTSISPAPLSKRADIPHNKAFVEISPPEATVTVDDAGCAVENRGIILEGTPGTKHSVSLRYKNATITKEVILLVDGTQPSRVELPRSEPLSSSKPKAATPSTPTAAPRPASTLGGDKPSTVFE
jgi:serine/threonine protein kinase